MYIKNTLLILVGLFFSVSSFAQQTALVKGKLINGISREPAHDIQVIIPELGMLATTNAKGMFIFSQVPYGSYSLVIANYSVDRDTVAFTVDKEVFEIKDIVVTYNESGTSLQSLVMPTIAMEEGNIDAEDEGISSQNVSGLLTASRDPFLNSVAFIFGPYFFQPRGYERNMQDVQINGITMNDVETGDAYWGQWGGLNDVFRSQSNTYGLQASDYSFGGINGNVYFDAIASSQREQNRITYSLSNRNYRNRLMFTKNSGLKSNGWAYSVSASKRWAKEGYVEGTFYDGYSYYLGVSKVMKKNSFHFTTFGAPTRRGKAYPHTQEMYDLAGTNFYNRNWGYQDGEKRNARVADVFQPAFIINHEYKPNDKFHWNTALGYQFGKSKNSSFDWYNAQNPWPDYYGYLPSYYLHLREPRPEVTEEIKRDIGNNPDLLQVDWNKIYNTNYLNYETIYDANGQQGNSVTGKRSLIVLSDFVEDMKKLSLNTWGSYFVDEHIHLYGGLNYINQRTENYKQLIDLLGGDFYVDLNQFAQRTFAGNTSLNQNDLNNTNRIIKEGDKYGYDYITNYHKTWVWGQGTFTYNRFDFFISANAGMNSFTREGVYRNGLFPESSFGKSTAENFLTYGVKGGTTYKINGRNYLFVNVGHVTQAPTIDNTYISPRLRNTTVTDPITEKIQSAEAGYYLKSPKLNGRLVGYATDIKGRTEIQRYYNDAPEYETFVNYVMRNINTRYTGVEFALEVKISPSFSATGVAATGQAFYTANPDVSIYRDNDTAKEAGNRKVHLNNYYLGVGAQSAYTLGLNYRSKKYWWANVNFVYLDRNYLDPSPDRRSGAAVDLIEPGSEQWHSVLDQEKAPSAYTINIFAGKSFRLSKVYDKIPSSTYLYVSVGVNNILNNTNIITGGFEQLRYSFDYATGIDKFPTKYFYGYGTNYFINLSLKF